MEGDKDDGDSDGSSNWFTDFVNWCKERFSDLGQWFENLGNSIGNFFNELWLNIKNSFLQLSLDLYTWFSNIGNWFSELGSNISNWFSNLWTNISNFFTKKDKDERDEGALKSDEMSVKADEINSVLDSKFGAFYTLGDFLKEFWNTIQNSGETKPDFKVTMPDFLGGGTYNVLDLSFYDKYRNYIHGIIAGICYFVYIKRMYNKIPNIIHNS